MHCSFSLDPWICTPLAILILNRKPAFLNTHPLHNYVRKFVTWNRTLRFGSGATKTFKFNFPCRNPLKTILVYLCMTT